MNTLAYSERRLSNGLRIVYLPIPNQVVATAAVVYRVGSRNESAGATGMAHFLEHMLFRGTHQHHAGNGKAFGHLIDGIGGYANAYTNADATVYHTTVPSVYLADVIELEADRMRHALLDPQAIAVEIGVVRNEYERMRNLPGKRLRQALLAEVFRVHPYGRITLGAPEDVASMTAESVRSFYDRFYQPQHAALIIAGGFSIADIDPVIETVFAAITPRSDACTTPVLCEPPQDAQRRVGIHHAGKEHVLKVAYRAPAVLDPNYPTDGYALQVLAQILAGCRTSIFQHTLIHKKLTCNASTAWQQMRDPAHFSVSATLLADVSAEQVLSTIDAAVAGIMKDGPRPLMFERAKLRIVRCFARDVETTRSLTMIAAHYESVADIRMLAAFEAGIISVTAEHVRDVAIRYLRSEACTIAELIPELNAHMVSTALLATDAGEHASRAQADLSPSMLIEKPIAPVDRSDERLSLHNALDVRYIHDATSSQTTMHGLVLQPHVANANKMLHYMHTQLLARGTKRRRLSKINAHIDDHDISRRYVSYTGPDRLHLTASCAAEELDALLELIGEELIEPSFTEESIIVARGQMGAWLARERSNIVTRAYRTIAAMLYQPGDVNALYDIERLERDLAAVTRDELVAYHAWLLTNSRIIIAAAGPMLSIAFADAFDRYIPAIGRTSGVADLPRTYERTVDVQRVHVEVPDRSEVRVMLGRPTQFHAMNDDRFAATLANRLLFTGRNARLRRRLREQSGLTYHVQGNFGSVSRIPGPWYISFGVNAAHVEQAIDETREVLAEFAALGPAEWEAVRAGREQAGAEILAAATHDGLLRKLLESMMLDALDEHHFQDARAFTGVTCDEVHAAAARYHHARDLVIVTAGSGVGL